MDALEIQQIVNNLAAQGGGTLNIPSGWYDFRTPLILPPKVDLNGSGMWSTILLFTDCDGIVAISDPYGQSGKLANFTILGNQSEHTGLYVKYRYMNNISRIQISGFAKQGALFENNIVLKIEDCILQNCGSGRVGPINSGFAQMEIDKCTVVQLLNNYIAGSTNSVGGIKIDRCPFEINGGSIESCGTLLIIGSKEESSSWSGPAKISNLDLGNPTNSYINIGSGWNGPAGQSIFGIRFEFCAFSPSGASDIPHGIICKDSDNLSVTNSRFIPTNNCLSLVHPVGKNTRILVSRNLLNGIQEIG